MCSAGCSRLVISRSRQVYPAELIDKALQLRVEGATRRAIASTLRMTEGFLGKLFHERGLRLSEEQRRHNIYEAEKNNLVLVVNGKKPCSQCGRVLPADCFSINRQTRSGLSPSCRECSRESYLGNSDIIKARNLKYKETHEEQTLRNHQNRYLRDPEAFKEKAKRWAQANPEKRRAIEKRYNAKNPGSKKARTAAYRANLRRAVPIWQTQEQRQQIRKIYAECPKGYCVDHIVPIAGENVSGLHVPWNLQHLPETENEQKCNKFDSLAGQAVEIGVCHQKVRRDQTEAEDRAAGMPFGIEAGEFELQSEPFGAEHRRFITRYEWLGNVGFGVRWCFTARHTGLLACVVLMSEPTAYSSFGKDLEVLIQRGAAASWAPKNLNSRTLMFACRWMVENTTKRLFVAYSDSAANEIGTIYQACNFDYLGTGYGAKFLYRLEGGRSVGQRHFTCTAAMKRWARALGIEWLPEWTKPNGFQDIKRIPQEVRTRLMDYAYEQAAQYEKVYVPSKGKYALLLGRDRREQRQLNLRKSWTPKPYPKRGA